MGSRARVNGVQEAVLQEIQEDKAGKLKGETTCQ